MDTQKIPVGKCECCGKDIYTLEMIPTNIKDACYITENDKKVRISGHYGSTVFDFGIGYFTDYLFLNKIVFKLESQKREGKKAELFICDNCVKNGIEKGSIRVLEQDTLLATPSSWIPDREGQDLFTVTAISGLANSEEIYIPIMRYCVGIKIISENINRIIQIFKKHPVFNSYIVSKESSLKDGVLVIDDNESVTRTPINFNYILVFIGSVDVKIMTEDNFNKYYEHYVGENNEN